MDNHPITTPLSHKPQYFAVTSVCWGVNCKQGTRIDGNGSDWTRIARKICRDDRPRFGTRRKDSAGYVWIRPSTCTYYTPARYVCLSIWCYELYWSKSVSAGVCVAVTLPWFYELYWSNCVSTDVYASNGMCVILYSTRVYILQVSMYLYRYTRACMFICVNE